MQKASSILRRFGRFQLSAIMKRSKEARQKIKRASMLLNAGA
jgi:hypothetical protein